MLQTGWVCFVGPQEHAVQMARQTENYVKTFRTHAHDHMVEKDNLEDLLVGWIPLPCSLRLALFAVLSLVG
jgi:hypothetical protein